MRQLFSVVCAVVFSIIFAGCGSNGQGSAQTAVAAPAPASSLTSVPTNQCKETYKLVDGSWQWEFVDGYVAHCDDRRSSGQGFKCKIDYISNDGHACTVAVARNQSAPTSWSGTSQGPMPVNFSSLFSDWQFGQSEIPPGEPSGKYGEVVAAKAWQ